MASVAIADYALLSDCHSAALVSRHGSVDWLCFPRFDSPSVFARLLDDGAGHWTIRAPDATETTRRYRDDTMVLETTVQTPTGAYVLTDALAVGSNERGHDLGDRSPHLLLRRITCLEGAVEIDVEVVPRPEYGLIHPLITPVNRDTRAQAISDRLRRLVQPLVSANEGGIVVRGGADVLLLSSPINLEITDAAARCRLRLASGQSYLFGLQHARSWDPVPLPLSQAAMARWIEDTTEGWRSWSRIHQRYDGPWRELVRVSGRILQALTYQPTGAIVAAPTTSLPETVGGARNWDYRYAWVRDASLTLEALWVAACPDEAGRFFAWMAHAAAENLRSDTGLQIMFGVGGEHDLSERELAHLAGWRKSRPVRVGNAAWSQRQLDVYGELLAAAHQLAEQLREMGPATREFLVAAANAAAERWKLPDQGIWEIRGEPQHFLHSKLMCWVALDRAIRLVDQLQAQAHLSHWAEVRDEIRAAILTHGWSERAEAFTQAFGSDALDASALMIPIVGFLPANDARVLATLEAIEARLTDDQGLVYRYRADDGLPGEEGSFLLCTFWLAQAQAMAGEIERARATFERAARYVNDLGLLSEEIDAATSELLGNFPQAFSHIGLINAAWAIAQAEPGPGTSAPSGGSARIDQGDTA